MTKIIAGVGTVVLAGGVTAGLAYADPTASPTLTPTASGSPTAGQPDRHKAKRALVRRALHGEAVVGGAKQTRTIAFQRGVVTKLDGDALTVRSTDGFSSTYRLTEKTRIREGRAAGERSDLAVQDKVRVVALKDGDTLTARVVRERVR